MFIPIKQSPEGEKFTKSFEACVLRAYPDPASALSKAMSQRGVLDSYMAGKSGIPGDLANLSGAPWTIGWGHTGSDVFPGLTWTQEYADLMYRRDIAPYEITVQRMVGVPITQGMFDALLDTLFNVGPGSSTRDGICRLKDGRPSSLVRKLNAGDYAGASACFMDWVMAGGQKMAGLERRRKGARSMFDSEKI